MVAFNDWMVAHFEPGAGAKRGAAALERPEGVWLPVSLPGDIHEALFAAQEVYRPVYAHPPQPRPFIFRSPAACKESDQCLLHDFFRLA